MMVKTHIASSGLDSCAFLVENDTKPNMLYPHRAVGGKEPSLPGCTKDLLEVGSLPQVCDVHYEVSLLFVDTMPDAGHISRPIAKATVRLLDHQRDFNSINKDDLHHALSVVHQRHQYPDLQGFGSLSKQGKRLNDFIVAIANECCNKMEICFCRTSAF